jgi:hypothetical protein
MPRLPVTILNRVRVYRSQGKSWAEIRDLINEEFETEYLDGELLDGYTTPPLHT